MQARGEVVVTEVVCRDGYTVAIEPEATERVDGRGADGPPAPVVEGPPWDIWLSLKSDGEIVSSAPVPVADLAPGTIRTAAFAYAEAWDRGPFPDLPDDQRKLLLELVNHDLHAFEGWTSGYTYKPDDEDEPEDIARWARRRQLLEGLRKRLSGGQAP